MAWHLAPSGCPAIWTSPPPQMLSGTSRLNWLCVAFDTPLLHSSTCSTGRCTRNHPFTPEKQRRHRARPWFSLLRRRRPSYKSALKIFATSSLFFPPCAARWMQTTFKLLKTTRIYSMGAAASSWVDTASASRCFSIRGAGAAADEELGLLLKPSASLFTSEPPYSE